VYFGLLLVYIALLSFFLLRMWQYGYRPHVQTAWVSQRAFTVMALVETALVVCLSPLFSLQATLATVLLSPARSATTVLGKLLLPGAFAAGIVVASALAVISLNLAFGGVLVVEIVQTHSLLLAYTLGLLALGCFCSAVCRTTLAAAGVTYLVVSCLVGMVIIVGPLISRLSQVDVFIHAVLVVNPFIGISSALGFDIMRTTWVYMLSPIGQRQFIYPAWYTVGVCYVLSACLLCGAAIWRVSSLRQRFDRWRE